jgi:hypothetical protein
VNLCRRWREARSSKQSEPPKSAESRSLPYGCNIRKIHHLDNCPTWLAGGAAGFHRGQHLVLPKNTPLCNLWRSILHGLGIPSERHGDSTALVKESHA